MTARLPYLVTPGSIKTALERIRSAATPDRVTGDFITTKLQIKGGTGAALLPYLKKIGFVASDGTPTNIYKNFRNPTFAGAAVAEAVKAGYANLREVNEYFYELNDKELLNLIVQVTGVAQNSQVAKLTLATLKALKSLANFDAKPEVASTDNKLDGANAVSKVGSGSNDTINHGRIGMNLSYTINLNLPATSDQSVFNAIFRSLKEHLLTDAE